MYRLVSLAEAEKELDTELPLFADSETIGLYGEIRLLQLYQVGQPVVLIVERPNPQLVQYFLSKFTSVWHNAHYDITTTQQQAHNRWIPEQFHDTFLLARLALPRLGEYTLDAVMTAVLGYDPYLQAGLCKKELQSSDWSGVLTKEQYLYAALDVYHLPAVFEAVKHKTEALSYTLDMLALRYALDFQWNGMPVDLKAVMDARVECIKTLRDNPIPINPNSYKQVRAWVPCTESDDLGLARLAIQGSKEAKLVRLHRKMLKRQNFLGK